ncbi:MAG: winged helix-turn-helix transcriptional regulator [Solirubrobacterales bacterium]
MPAAESGQRPRAGSAVLTLLAVPLNGLVLRALADGPMRLAALRDELGGPAQSTLRGILTKLVKIGVLTRGLGDKPSILAYQLTPFGEDLLLAVNAVEAWLGMAPDGPIALESARAKVAIKALVGGWVSTLVRALAARPLTLTELDKLIDGYTYPAIERRLSAMRLAGQVELGANDNGNKGRQYTISPWLRLGVGPLTVATRCERKHMADTTAPIARIDVESAFLLVAPMLNLNRSTSGSCQVAVEAGRGDSRKPWAGAQLTVEKGSVSSCIARLEPRPESWAHGAAGAWLDAVIGRTPDLLAFGGDAEFGREIVEGLHDVLFSIFARSDSSALS